MNTSLSHHEALDLLPFYALGTLEPEAMLAVDAVLTQSPELQKRLRELEDLVGQLAYTTPQHNPPSAARTRLLERLSNNATAQATPRATQHGQSPPLPASQPRAASRRHVRLNPIFAAFALTLVALLGGYTLHASGRINQLQAQVAQLQATNQQLQADLAANQNQLALVMNAEQSVALTDTGLAQGATGTFYYRESQGVFTLSGLAQLPPDRVYQAWLVPPGGTPTSVGLVPTDVGNAVTFTVDVPPGLRNFAIVDVSIEQAGGSPTITKETIVLRGEVS